MSRMNRRNFLWIAGAIVAAPPAAVALDLASSSAQPSRADLLTFRAVAPLPQQPLPAYASYVLSGHLDTTTGSGTITQTVFAGAPSDMSEIALPGLSRAVRVTGVTPAGDQLHITGVVDDRSQLRPGESPNVAFQLDRARGVIAADVLGTTSELRLA